MDCRWTHALTALVALAFAQQNADAYAAFTADISGRRRLSLPPQSSSPTQLRMIGSYLDSLSDGETSVPDEAPKLDYLETLSGAELPTRPPTRPSEEPKPEPLHAESVLPVSGATDVQPKAEEIIDARVVESNDGYLGSLSNAEPMPNAAAFVNAAPWEASVASTAASTLGASPYVMAKEKIRDSKSRAQRRLDRTRAEREKAAEKIRRMRARVEAQTKRVEDELQEKLGEIQGKIDLEVGRISELLAAEINFEYQREGEISDLLSSLRSAIDLKEAEIAAEDIVTADMMDFRSKLKPGSSATQFDGLLSQKTEVATIERKLLRDLIDCEAEMKAVLSDAQFRGAKMEKILGRIQNASGDYEWSDIDEMEAVLDQAATNVMASDARIKQLRDSVSQALRDKSDVLNEPLPENAIVPVSTVRMVEKTRANIKPFLDEVIQTAAKYGELKDKEDKVVVQVLAKSLGKVALDSSMAAILGLRAVLDTVTGEPVSEAASEALEKLSAVRKLSGFADSVKIDSRDDLAKLAENEKIRGAGKMGDALDAVGKTGKEIACNLGSSQSAEQARDALKETSKDVVSAANALAALSLKLGQKGFNMMKDSIDDVSAESKAKVMGAKKREKEEDFR